MEYRYVGRCVELNGDDLAEMIDFAREVTRATFIRRVGRKSYLRLSDALGYCQSSLRGLTLANDDHVRYHRSVYRGKPCYFVVHGAIEYVFVKIEEEATTL